MRRVARFLFILIFFISLASGCKAYDNPPLSEAWLEAPEFRLYDTSGKEASLSDYRGKEAVLLVFWTTWCPYCRQALRSLKEEYPSLKDMGIELLAIDIGEPLQKVRSFAQALGLDFPVLLDQEGRVSGSYDVLGVPTYFIISKAGGIVFSGNSLPRERLKGLASE